MQSANVHRIHEAPPADAFAHVRLSTTLAHQAPASHSIGGTVARWRERDAEALDLGMYPIVEPQADPSRVLTGICYATAISLLLWLAIGVAIAHFAGRF
ncbi:hypothetical protein [Sphingomonas sp. CROZ-RG-20F-R02-07]|uniref:hypothetical protein n=1 Tax=Sphingomonas sp. CROZ-RG-20F-R02-07 TaxID=2914832 RepID=UPI001F58E193|nr:hypothetical protein [Sphingomonas sp. CROZ-RG-20F-R02-07]